EVFSHLRVWDTEHNNGVLVYLLLADRDVEIIADRGINAKVRNEEWESICRDMEAIFAQGRFEQGVIAGIEAIGRHLQEHFPTQTAGGENELPDRPAIL
ncbi:MAG: TPM domain-containing protein, partial [Betaproteobacteria bacterium]|nr:TPM domain-containing protein [Betaproteobacteria bacterium]